MCDDEPTCRASIRDGTVTLHGFNHRMYRGGPAPAALAHVSIALADLHRPAEGELLVVPVPGPPWDEDAEAALVAWAGRVGYERVWLPGTVVTLDGLPALTTAAVDCPTCGAHWEDAAVGFWEMVRENGWFPGACRVCGGSLPEWESVAGVG